MNQGVVIRQARREEEWAKVAFDRACNAVRNLQACIQRPFPPHWFDVNRALRDLAIARSAKDIAHRDWQSARRVRRSLAGDDVRRTPVVWLR
jgi:hypothetical protein